jgi:hypothetical protein
MNDTIHEIFSRALQSTIDEQYSNALQDFRWLHDHPDDDSVEYTAIRRNFVLAAWAMLGVKYEPAAHSLKALLDEKSTRLLTGDKNPLLQGDIDAIKSAIAKYLG